MMDIETIRTFHEDAQFIAEYDCWMTENALIDRLTDYLIFLGFTEYKFEGVPY